MVTDSLVMGAIAIPERLGSELQWGTRSTHGFKDLCQKVDPKKDTISTNDNTNKFYSTLLQVFVRGNPFGTSARLTWLAPFWLDKVVGTIELHAVAFYGSPYILEEFLPYLSPRLPYGFSYGQMPQSQECLRSATIVGSSKD